MTPAIHSDQRMAMKKGYTGLKVVILNIHSLFELTQVFPAVILMSVCPDLVFTAAQIIASNAVKRYQQGAAASLVGTLLLYGSNMGLGFAGTIETQVDQTKHSKVVGYRAALWFSCAIAVLALILNLGVVKMKKDEREGWQEE
jgi:hypothetical protein